MFIKMRIIKSAEFDAALSQCQMSFGCLVQRKRTLVWLVCFNGDEGIIRATLEDAGSKYAGKWTP